MANPLATHVAKATTPMDGMNYKMIQEFPGCKRPYTMQGMGPFAQVFKQISRVALPTSMSGLGTLQATGAAGCLYDIYLLEGRSAPHVLVYMNLQFSFVNGKDNNKQPLVWTSKEKTQFVAAWENAVTSIWNTHGLTVTGDRKPVNIQFRFGSNIEVCPPNQHWQINVHKVPHAEALRSDVNRKTHISNIAHLDNTTRPMVAGNIRSDAKIFDNNILGPDLYFKQSVSAHEFAHMVGIRDEYKDKDYPDRKNTWDYRSVAAKGNEVRSWHLAYFKAWADREIRKLEKLRQKSA